MSDSRINIKQLIRTGQFSKRVNLEKTKEISGIPERTEKKPPSLSTEVGVGLGVALGPDQPDNHATQTEDLFFLPSDIQTPISVGSSGGYAAIPSIITYSSARGVSRISIHTSKPNKMNLDTIKEVPRKQVIPPAYDSTVPVIPVIPPPRNFKPIRNTLASPAIVNTQPHLPSTRSTSPYVSQLSQSSTTRTSIRTSIASDVEKTIPKTSSRSHEDSPPASPITNTKIIEDKSNILSWSLPSPVRTSQSNSSLPSYTPHINSTKSESGHNYLQGFKSPPSRFSWNASNTNNCSGWFTRWFIDWWALEILSWGFSALCMAIIAIVLLKHDGKDLPSWRLGITINAFISIFSGFAKSALLLPTAEALGQLKWSWFKNGERKMVDFEILDSASRGPWGSLVLLTRTKGITLVSVGAAIILLSLPLDLFFQQIVSYPTVWVKNGTASIQRSTFYTPTPIRNIFNGTSLLGPDYDLQASSMAYIWGQGAVPQTVKDCPTSNCTFPAFESLSVCSACAAMPTLLERGCYNTTGDWLSGVNPTGGIVPNITTCGWFWKIRGRTPILMTGYRQNQDGSAGEAMSMRMVPMADLLTRKPLVPGGSINFKNVRNPIADFVVAAVEGGLSGAYQNRTPVVHECELHWCVKSYQSNVWLGDLQETTRKPIEFDSNGADDPWVSVSEYRPNFTMTIPDPHSGDNGVSVYGLNNVTARQTIQIWDLWLPSTLVGTAPSDSQFLKWQWRSSSPSLRRMEDVPWMPPNDIPKFVSNIALATSNTVRRTVNDGSTKADTIQGTAWSERTMVEIRWIWISLPAVLLVGSLIFLVVTIMRSSKEKDTIGVWKTSALAVLLSGVGEEIQDRVGPQVRVGQARKEARDMKVKLYE